VTVCFSFLIDPLQWAFVVTRPLKMMQDQLPSPMTLACPGPEVLNKAYLEVLNKAYLEVLNKAYLEAQSKAYPGALYQVHTENHVVHHCYS
jgi:hypothetical protein